MKKFYSLLTLFAMIVATTLCFIACGSDDDDSNDNGTSSRPNNVDGITDGQVSVKFADSSTTTYYAIQSDWIRLNQQVTGGSKYDSVNGYTFSTSLSSDLDVEAVAKKKNDYGEYWEVLLMNYTWLSWQFQTKDPVSAGGEISIDGIFWNDAAINTKQEGGKIIVKSVSNDIIILSFDNLQFKRCKVWGVGNSEFEMLTVNGEITFKQDK